MKKWLISSVSVVALLTLSACGQEEEATQAPPELTTEQPADAVAEDTAEATEEAGDAAQEAGDAMTEAGEAAGTAANQAAETVGNAAERAAEAASQLADGASEATQQAAQGASDMAGQAGDAINDAAEATGDALRGAAETADRALEGAAGAANDTLASVDPGGPLDDTRWISSESEAAFITFEGETVSGNSGCNTFTGTFEAGDDGALELGTLATTNTECAEEVMTAEAEFLAALGSVDAYAVQSDTLTLSDAEGNELLSLNRATEN